MKYVIVIPDGAADEPQETLGGKSPLEAAVVPAMDSVVECGLVARACHTPHSLPAGSEVGNMSLLGYDPIRYFTGRAPIEAAAQGISLGPDDWAVRCNLVNVQNQTMCDFTADHIGTAESRELLQSMQCWTKSRSRHASSSWTESLEFVPGVSYRNLMVWRSAVYPAPFTVDSRATPPHDLTDQSVVQNAPRGPGCDKLVATMDASAALFRDHPVNAKREAYGRLPATHVWLWGMGKTPRLPSFAEQHGVRGAMITAVDLLRGLAALVGWDRIEVPGATGYTDTDFTAKGRYAIDALERYDLVCIHVEAPDEASHEGDAAGKVQALEAIDREIVAPLLEALPQHGDWRMMISPDHPTFLRTKTHSHGYVPVAMAGSGVAPDDLTRYSDAEAARSKLVFDDGWRVMSKWMEIEQ